MLFVIFTNLLNIVCLLTFQLCGVEIGVANTQKVITFCHCDKLCSSFDGVPLSVLDVFRMVH